MNQKDAFLAEEGNAWYQRNCKKLLEVDEGGGYLI
jgi:hypothetical protein